MARSRPHRTAVHVRVSTHDQAVEKFARQPASAINLPPHTTRCHELANAPQTATLVAGQLRRHLSAHVEAAVTFLEALQRAITAMQTLRQGGAS